METRGRRKVYHDRDSDDGASFDSPEMLPGRCIPSTASSLAATALLSKALASRFCDAFNQTSQKQPTSVRTERLIAYVADVLVSELCRSWD